MEIGYPFPTISTTGEDRRPVRGSLPLSASRMTGLLKQSAAAAGVYKGVSPCILSGRGGGGFASI